MNKFWFFLALAGLAVAGYLVLDESDTPVEPLHSTESGRLSVADRSEPLEPGARNQASVSSNLPARDDDSVKSDETPQSADSGQHSLETVVVNDSLSQNRAIEVISGDSYQDVINALQEQSLTSEQAMRNQEYEQHLTQRPEFHDGSLALKQMQCGTALCTMSVAVNDEEAWKRYFEQTISSDEYPTYVMINYPLENGNQQEQRLLFSVDPTISSMTFSSN